MLLQSTTLGRAVLQRVLQGRITFTPNGAGYDFAAPTRFDKLFAGVVYMALPAYLTQHGDEGKEAITPEVTLDADYGQLLERLYANPPANQHCKGLASSAGQSSNTAAAPRAGRAVVIAMLPRLRAFAAEIEARSTEAAAPDGSTRVRYEYPVPIRRAAASRK